MSMLFSFPMCLVFWCQVWRPYARERLGVTFVDELLARYVVPSWPVLRVLGPLCVQRMIADGVTARLAWLLEHRVPIWPRFGEDSNWNWTEIVTRRFPRKDIRAMSQHDVRYQIGIHEDWLIQILIFPSEMASAALRLMVLVCLCSRLMQCYRELCRRVGYQQARAMLAEDMLHYLGPQATVLVPGVTPGAYALV